MTRNDKPKRRPQRKADDQRVSRPSEKRPRPGRQKTDSERRDDTGDAHAKLSKICGMQAVTGLFQADPERIIRLYYQESLKHLVGPFCAQLAKLHRPYRLVDGDELTKIAGTVLHGGIVAAAMPRIPRPLDLVAAQEWAKRGESLLILDGVGNPHNLGAIARTMAFFGMRHLLISDHPAQAGLSDAAHRVAEGGLDAIEVYQFSHVPKVLKRLGKFYRVIGTTLAPDAVPPNELEADPRPVALVLGNEEKGLSSETLSACDCRVMIPGTGSVQSLNVSASAAIFIYELAVRQRLRETVPA